MKWACTRYYQWRQTEQGQNLIEFALVLPMLLLLLLGIIDIGLGFRTYIALTNAAREGVRWVSIYPSDCSGALARVESEAAHIGIDESASPGDGGYTPSISGSCPFSAGDRVTITVRYDYELLFGALTDLPSVPFRSSATMVVLYDE